VITNGKLLLILYIGTFYNHGNNIAFKRKILAHKVSIKLNLFNFIYYIKLQYISVFLIVLLLLLHKRK